MGLHWTNDECFPVAMYDDVMNRAQDKLLNHNHNFTLLERRYKIGSG